MISVLPRTLDKALLEKQLQTIAEMALSKDQVNINVKAIEKNIKNNSYTDEELSIATVLLELINNLKRG